MYWVSILMSVCDVIAVVIDLAAIVVGVSEFVLLLEPGSFQRSKFVSHSCLILSWKVLE